MTLDEEDQSLFTSQSHASRASSLRSRIKSPISSGIKRPQIWPLLLLLILVHMALKLYDLPLNRVIEKRLCDEHYAQHDPSAVKRDGSIPEKLCKIDEVQQQLAWLQGIMETTYVVCGTWTL